MSTYSDVDVISGGRLRGVPVSHDGVGASPEFEFGSVTGVSATGRYKSFATPFVNKPFVVVVPILSAGSNTFVLKGTPNVGSFNVRGQRVGSAMLQYVAWGRR